MSYWCHWLVFKKFPCASDEAQPLLMASKLLHGLDAVCGIILNIRLKEESTYQLVGENRNAKGKKPWFPNQLSVK